MNDKEEFKQYFSQAVAQRLQENKDKRRLENNWKSWFNVFDWHLLKVICLILIVISVGIFTFACLRKVWPMRAPIAKVISLPETVAVSNNTDEKLKAIEDRLDIIEAKFSSNYDKLQVLGIVFNENAFIIKNKQPLNHLIYISKNWGTSSKPRYIILTPEDERVIDGQRGGGEINLSPPKPDSFNGPVEDRFSAIESKVNEDANKLYVLALALNENAILSSSSQRPQARDFIYINSEWKMSKYPSKIKVPESWKKEIQALTEN